MDFDYETEVELIEDESRTIVWLRLFLDYDNDVYIDRTEEFNHLLTYDEVEQYLTNTMNMLLDTIEKRFTIKK